MSSVKISDSFLPAGLLPGLLIAALPCILAAQQPGAAGDAPFTIQHADRYSQRSSGDTAQVHVLEGDVHVTRAGSSIRCRLLTYNSASSRVVCLDSVLYEDSLRTLRCDTLTYLAGQARYIARGSLRWTSGQMSGTGRRGYYNRRRGIMAVGGDATGRDSLRTISADSLEYDDNEIMRANGSVKIVEPATGSVAKASAALYERRTGRLVMTGRPEITYFDDDNPDQPYNLVCDYLQAWGSDSLCAVGRVRLWEDSLSIESDSLFHDRVADMSFFRGGPPLVTHPRYRLTGDILDVRMSGSRSLELIEAVGRARGDFFTGPGGRVAQEPAGRDDLTPVASWITGDSLELYFGENRLDSLSAGGDARSYFRQDDQTGISYIRGARIMLIWRNQQLEVVEVLGGGRGIFLPADSTASMTVIPDSSGFCEQPDTLPGVERH